jgi:hypothetical protein
MRRCAAALTLSACLTGCGTYPPSPVEIAENYVNALGEGNYAGACGMLDSGTRESLTTSSNSHGSCTSVFARCLPREIVSLKRDQTQLLYANEQATITGSEADVAVSGTAVAAEIKQVKLVKERGNWMVSSYGKVLRDCRHLHGAQPPA